MRSESVTNARLRRGSESQRQRIVQAATRLFAKQGYACVTIDDIAMSIGATKGIVYYYFRSKSDLLYHAHHTALERITAVFASMAESSESSPKRLEEALRAHLSTVLENRFVVRMLTRTIEVNDEGVLRPEQRKALTQERAAYESLFLELVGEGVASGQLSVPQPELWTKFVIGALNSTVDWFKPGRPISREAMIDATIDAVMRGIVVSTR